ncbi:hypothetical protein ACLOJK_040324 [Asimina triloba]
MADHFDAGNYNMEVGKLHSREAAPEDHCNFAYMIHFLLGAGNLLPWNALITAVDYFGYLYPNEHIDKVFSVAFMGSSLPVVVILVSWTNWGRRPSVGMRMNLGFLMFVASLLTVPVMDWAYVHGARRSSKAYCVTVAAVAVCGLADGLVGGSLIGSGKEVQAILLTRHPIHTLPAGVLLSILRIITKAALPQTPRGLQTSAHLYFVVSTIIIVSCLVCYNILDRLPIIQHHRCSKNLAIRSHTTLREGPPSSPTTIVLCNANEPTARPKFWTVWKRIRWLTAGVLVTYVTTLSIFPGYITENVQSKLLHDWYPILLITMYNASDLVGKCSTAMYVPKSTKKVTLACFARLLFFPLFAVCMHGPAFFRTEVPVMILTSALGVTNGFLTSTLMILAPKLVHVTEVETAGILMALFLGIGLAGGSVLGWFWLI